MADVKQVDRTADSGVHFTAIAIGVAAGFLFCGYECIRTSSNTLFKEPAPIGYGTQALPYIDALIPFAVLLAVYGYGRLLTWCGPRKTLFLTSALSAAAIALCYGAIWLGLRPARGALYLLREAYIVLLVEQYWSFLNSRLGTAAAKKWNGPICGIGSFGAILGARAVQQYATTIGTRHLVIVAAVAIVPALLLSDWAYARSGEPPDQPAKTERHGDTLGLATFKSNPMLALLLVVILATQMLAAVLNYSFQNQLQAAIPAPDAQSAWQGGFWSDVNICAAIGQFVVSPILLRVLPLSLLHAFIPLLNLAICAYAWQHRSLESAALALLAFKTMDYSVFRAGKELLYIPFSYDVRYRAKELIDVWGYRFSKGTTGWLLSFLEKVCGVATTDTTYSVLACGAAGVWLLAIVPACRFYQRHVQGELVGSPGAQSATGG